MKVIFGGARGTSCTADSRFMAYGGDTTAVLILGGRGERIIVDAGTGLRRLADVLKKNGGACPLTLLMTHFHLDHVMGLPSFGPIYETETDLTVWAVRRGREGVREIMGGLMKQPFWPVELRELHSRLCFRDLENHECGGPIQVGGLKIRWCSVQHPGGCTAYRIEESDAALVFATDVEWARTSRRQRRNFERLCTEPTPACCLIMDGQFTRSEYSAYEGWGHSTWEDVVQLGKDLAIPRVVVTHHSPHLDDLALAKREQQMRNRMAGALFARDGMEVIL